MIEAEKCYCTNTIVTTAAIRHADELWNLLRTRGNDWRALADGAAASTPNTHRIDNTRATHCAIGAHNRRRGRWRRRGVAAAAARSGSWRGCGRRRRRTLHRQLRHSTATRHIGTGTRSIAPFARLVERHRFVGALIAHKKLVAIGAECGRHWRRWHWRRWYWRCTMFVGSIGQQKTTPISTTIVT
jgi:hypothetical protein